MAAPSYATDLQLITDAESTTGWSALGGGGAGLGVGADFSMQGSLCVDKQITNTEKGHVFGAAAAITPGANTHFFVWVFLATPGLAAALASRGLAIIAGTATNAYTAFHVEGNDTYGAAGRVAKCYPVRYANTANGSIPYRTLTGSPGANPKYFGSTANITATVKGANLGIDAIRHGTGIFITAGDGTTPATLVGASSQNDAVANRWGILTLIGGSNYELQGRFVVGQDTAGTPTAAHFDDSNKNILLVDTPHSLSDFTQLIIDHAATVFNLTNITIEAAGANNPGQLVFNNASTVANLTGCTFIKMGTTILRAGVTATNCTWRQTGQITQNSALINSPNFNDSAQLVIDILNNMTDASFVSPGTGHAIEYTGAAGTFDFNHSFSGYGADGTTDAVFHNSSGNAITLNVASGFSTPTVLNTNGSSTTVVTAQTSFGFTINPAITGYEWRLYVKDVTAGIIGTIELAGEESATLSSQTYTYTHSVDTDAVVQIIADGYEESLNYLTLGANNQNLTINLDVENNT